MIRLGTLTAGTMGFCTVAVLGLMMGKEWGQTLLARGSGRTLPDRFDQAVFSGSFELDSNGSRRCILDLWRSSHR